jgi:hypothetical protein
MTSPLLPIRTAADLLDIIGEHLGDHVDLDDQLGAASKMHERVMARAHEWAEGHYILAAERSGRATTTMRVTFASGTVESIRILTGQVLFATPWGVRYRLTEALRTLAGQAPGYDVTADVEAEWPGFDGNVDAEHINEIALPESVDPALFVDWDPVVTVTAQAEFVAGVEAGTITCLADADATGGADGTLDLLAAERGMPAEANETTEALRARIHALPDTITPAGIVRSVNRALEPWGITATLEEPWDFGMAIGVRAINVAPIGRVRMFVVHVPALPWATRGIGIGNASNGVVGASPIGVTDPERAAVYAALQALVRRIKLAGVWGRVVEDV